jgi:hypothetical protein
VQFLYKNHNYQNQYRFLVQIIFLNPLSFNSMVIPFSLINLLKLFGSKSLFSNVLYTSCTIYKRPSKTWSFNFLVHHSLFLVIVFFLHYFTNSYTSGLIIWYEELFNIFFLNQFLSINFNFFKKFLLIYHTYLNIPYFYFFIKLYIILFLLLYIEIL